MSGGFLLAAAYELPVHVGTKAFHKNDTARLSLNGDSELFTTRLTVGNVSKMTYRGTAALREINAIRHGQAIKVGFEIHGRNHIHRLVLSSTPYREFTKRLTNGLM